MREITYAEAIREAMSEEMRRDENVYLLGEDVGLYGGAFGVSVGMMDEFGEERVTIDYSKQSIDNTIEIIVLSEDRKREFKAEVVLFEDNDIEMDGRRYSVYDLILALNTSFNKRK